MTSQRVASTFLYVTCSVMLAVAGVGCAAGDRFRVKASQPWPDEWVSGVRTPYERLIHVSVKTVEWHRKLRTASLEGRLVAMLAERHDLYGFVRTGVAQPQNPSDLVKGMRYIEIKIAPSFFEFRKTPPKVTLDYEAKPFKEVMADLMGRVGRSYLISPELDDQPKITAHLVGLDWREAAVRLMLDCDVFVEPVWYNPVSLRSYEYVSQRDFLAAVRRVIESLDNPAPETPLTIVPWEQWVENNRAYQLRFDASLRARPTTQQYGPPPGTAILSSDLAIAKKQILYALPYQIRLRGQDDDEDRSRAKL